MELKWLEDFLSLAKTRNFSRSSEERNVTQPAFSRRIKALESWLGVELINRRVFPAGLTPEGRIFLDTAETIVQQLYHDRAQFSKKQGTELPALRIAAATTLNLNFIPAWLKELEKQIGAMTFRVKTENFNNMVTDLSDGNIDLVLQYCASEVPVLFDSSKFDSLTLARDRMIIVCPCLESGKPMFNIDDFKDIPFFGYSQDGYFRAIQNQIFAVNDPKSSRFRRIGESPTSEFLRQMALEFGAATLLPESCVTEDIRENRLARLGEDDWSMNVDIHIYRLKDSKRLIVRRVWKQLQKNAHV